MSDDNKVSNKFMCIECGNQFNTFEQLKEHYSSIHSQQKLLETGSSSNFEKHQKTDGSKSTSLLQHIKENSDKNFECEICEESFSKNKYLIDHLQTHTHQNDHKCKICGKRLSTKGNLSTHMEIHSDERKLYK